jgi:hypothetical protein
MTIEEAKTRHEAALLALPNVVGVGVGSRNDRPVITVFVTRRVAEELLGESEIVPKSVEGYPTNVEQIGHVGPATDAESANRGGAT